MEPGMIIFLLFILFWFGSYFFRKKKDKEFEESVDADSFGGPVSIPLSKRLSYFLKSRFSSRPVYHYEMAIDIINDENELIVTFHVPRRPIYVEIIFPATPQVLLKSVEFIDENDNVLVSREFKYLGTDPKIKIRIYPPEIILTKKIDLKFDDFKQHYEYDIQITITGEFHKDQALIENATELYESGRKQDALNKILEYTKIQSKNFTVLNFISTLYGELNNPDKGQEYAIRAAVNGLHEAGLDKYISTPGVKWFEELDKIEKLKNDYAAWELKKHYGLVALAINQRYILGVDGWYIKQQCEIFQVRRAAAARMLGSISFEIAGFEQLLYSNCRLIRNGQKPQEIPRDQFVIGDSQERNIYITVEAEKTGSWILREMSNGDIIEMNYHLLCRESRSIEDEIPHFIIKTNLNHAFYPTLYASTKFEAPENLKLHFGQHNGLNLIEKSESDNNDRHITSFELHKYIPITGTKSLFEKYLCNPTVSCATTDFDWNSVAKSVLKINFGDIKTKDNIPVQIKNILATRKNSREILKDAFYWVRDKLKYASVGSAIAHIGRPDRAEEIIKSGIADCKDKTYLLHLVCKELELNYEIVAVSAKYGIIYDDLPSNQFDHVFLRVLMNNEWLYLDASSRFSTFGICPPIYQGLNLLTLNGKCKIENIPEDPPEKNCLSFTETFDLVKDDWMVGTYDIRAEGSIARLIDENWKWNSMHARDTLQSSQAILNDLMPSIILMSNDIISQTFLSDSFEVLGTHKRCQLSRLGNTKVGILEWREPTLPLGYWRNIVNNRLFVFYLPISIEINIIFIEALRTKLEEFSDPINFENDICKINEILTHDDDTISICRKIVIKKKMVKENLIDQFPETMEQIEKALQMAFILK